MIIIVTRNYNFLLSLTMTYPLDDDRMRGVRGYCVGYQLRRQDVKVEQHSRQTRDNLHEYRHWRQEASYWSEERKRQGGNWCIMYHILEISTGDIWINVDSWQFYKLSLLL